MVYLLGISAAILLAVGFVLQQHAAEEEPPSLRLSPKLLVDLARRPRWLLGIATMVAGQILGAIALGRAAVALVEPLLAANLLFALPLTALYHRLRIRWVDLLGALVLIAGLAAFVAGSAPHGGSARSPDAVDWGIAFGALIVAVMILLTLQRRLQAIAAATLLATCAGLIFGMQDAVTQAADGLLERGPGQLLGSWVPYALVMLAVFGLLLAQSGFNAAPLSASLPSLTAAEPLVGITLGIALFGEHVHTTPIAIVWEVLGVIAIVGGIVVLGRSPLVTGEHPELNRSG